MSIAETGRGQPMGFSNGMSDDETDAMLDIAIDIVRLTQRIQALGRHRSYSLAITKLEEAKLWLMDRQHKPKES